MLSIHPQQDRLISVWFPLWSHIPVLRVVFLIFSDGEQLPKQVGELITKAPSDGEAKGDFFHCARNRWENQPTRLLQVGVSSLVKVLSDYLMLGHKWAMYISTSKAQGTPVSKKRKEVNEQKEAGKDGWRLSMDGSFTLELTVAVIACTASVPCKIQQHPVHRMRRGSWTPPLHEVLSK